MGKLVNVVRSDGKVVAIPEEDAARLSGAGIAQPETDQDAAARVVGAKNEARAEGFTQGAKAFLEGGADALSGGLFGKIAGGLSPDYAEEMANRGTYQPGARLAGELATVVTSAGLPGLARGAGEAVTGRLAARAVNPLTPGANLAASSAGRVIEGGILGAGGHVASTNVTGDPLTIEGTMLGIGVGSFLNVGIGAAADKVRRVGDKARTMGEEVAAQKADVTVVKQGRELFEKNVDGWDSFQESVKSAVADESRVFNEAKKAAKQYEDFLTPKRIDGALRQAEKARNEIQSRINQTKYGKAVAETGEAFDEASGQLGKLKDKADDLLSSTEDWPKTMDKVQGAIDSVRSRWAPREAGETLFKPKLQGHRGEIDEKGIFTSDGTVHTATKKPPISEETDALLTEYSERASTIRKMRQGGFKLDKKKRWVEDASIKPDPEGALRELHKLRTDFSKKYGGEVFPDLPEIPRVEFPSAGARPAAGPAGQMDELRDLMLTSKALSDGIGSARKKFKAGDYEGAADELRALRERANAAGQNDLVLPEVPLKTKAPDIGPETVKIPKTLLEFARMSPSTAERLSNMVAKSPKASEEFLKVANQLGTDAADSVAGLHSKLGKYMGAADRLKKMADDEAADSADGFLGVLRRGAKKFVRYGSARAADVSLGGGWRGAFGRVAAGEGVNAAMNTTEDLLSGAMMQGKLGVKQAVASIVTKMTKPTARTLKELGPITAYLNSRLFTSEEEDGEAEDLAVKRITEVFSTAGTASDAAYIAVQSLLGHPSDAAFKLHQKAVGDVTYLAQMAPKDPGIAMHGLVSEWKPSPEEARTFAYRIEAVVDPLKAIARTIAGDGHPAGVETLWARWPALMQTAAEEFAFALHDADMDREVAANYSTLFRTPITGHMQPEVMLTLQGLYLPKPEEGARPQVASSGRPVGRPAAYDSQVAGSSVSGLLS